MEEPRPGTPASKRFKLISCEVLYRELCFALARSPHQIDLEFLPKGLHDIGCAGMVARLQAAVDAVDASRYDAILLGYGLCNYGISGLRAPSIPMVVPRAHDCMTLFLGSKERYLEYFQENPGTYFLTSGWIERGEATGDLKQLSIQAQSGMDMTYAQLVEKYGEDNARFLWDQLYNTTRHYRQMTYIEMGVEPDDRFLKTTRERAAQHNLAFSHEKGSMRLLFNLMNGEWDDKDFLVVPPGWKIAARVDEDIVVAEKVEE